MDLGEARLLRVYGDEKATLGLATFPWAERPLWTIERPWLGNKPFVSCVPAGAYTVRWTYSPRFKRWTWALLGVPGRSGIRIHAANYAVELEGCISPGLRVGSGKHGLAVWNSRSALSLVERTGAKEAYFKLVVSGLTK